MKILTKHFGFFFVSQRGSHVKLERHTFEGTISTVVPVHKELARGTLHGVLKLAEVDIEEFKKFL